MLLYALYCIKNIVSLFIRFATLPFPLCFFPRTWLIPRTHIYKSFATVCLFVPLFRRMCIQFNIFPEKNEQQIIITNNLFAWCVNAWMVCNDADQRGISANNQRKNDNDSGGGGGDNKNNATAAARIPQWRDGKSERDEKKVYRFGQHFHHIHSWGSRVYEFYHFFPFATSRLN